MSKPGPEQLEYQEEFNEILKGIESPVDRAAFNFFYRATCKEGIQTPPHFTWDQFEGGIAPFNDLPLEVLDQVVRDTGLVRNYDQPINGTTPLTEALGGSFVRAVHRARQSGAVRITGIHPSIATPFLIARGLGAAYMQEFGEDIRADIDIVVGAYPTVMNYRMKGADGRPSEISPVDIGRSLANLLLTAPRTASTETDETAVQDWMNEKRAQFKVNNRERLAKTGRVTIFHAAGRRGRLKPDTHSPREHIEYRPDSSTSYITSIDGPVFVVGTGDDLLNNPASPSGEVYMLGDPKPFYPKTDSDVVEMLERSAALASHGDDLYQLESWLDQKARRGLEWMGVGKGREPDS